MYQENEYQYYMKEIDEKMHEEFNRDSVREFFDK